MSRPSFDRLARPYRLLEFLAFGRDLERARFCLLDRLRDCRKILVLGEGDGRCLARLVRIAPAAEIHCLDLSDAMLARAAARIADTADAGRVTFTQADVLAAPRLPPDCDAVVTCFFLDCFSAEQAARVVASVASALRPEARWLIADFVLPARGLARLRARMWVGLLYAFFRWQTGLRTRALPPSEELIAAAGFTLEARQEFQHGLVRSVSFRRP
ncbi:MAG TPA: class I SAM-dependent methyltransferase [Opitutaceae bacterium]|nr:class I SAM-dependent methyltransferase [Opitutaceae bacterium]